MKKCKMCGHDFNKELSDENNVCEDCVTQALTGPEFWRLLDDVAVDEDAEFIDQDFLYYKHGTELYDIWHDFEDKYDVCMGDIATGEGPDEYYEQHR